MLEINLDIAIKGLILYYHLNSCKDGLFSSKKMIESKPL